MKDAEVSEKRAQLRASLASGKPLNADIANDKDLRKDYDYDVSGDVNRDETLDIDDEYSELSGVVGMFNFLASQSSSQLGNAPGAGGAKVQNFFSG